MPTDGPLFTFHALASGSSGNAYLLRTEKVAILVEAGLRLPLLRTHLAGVGLRPEELTAVFISHEHRDHCLAARDLAVDCGAAIYTNAHVLKAMGLHDLSSSRVVEPGETVLVGDVEVSTFRVQHDAVCPVGFLIRARDRTICLATDLGQGTDEVQEAVNRSDLVVLEANHDYAIVPHGRSPSPSPRRAWSPNR